MCQFIKAHKTLPIRSHSPVQDKETEPTIEHIHLISATAVSLRAAEAAPVAVTVRHTH